MKQVHQPSPPEETEQQVSQPTGADGTHPRRLPRWIWIVCLGAPLLALGALRWFSGRDHAIGHAISFVVLLLAIGSVLGWFLFFSHYRRAWRLRLAGAVLLCLALVTALFQFEGVNGELVPRFKFRWSSASQLDEPSHEAVDLATVTPADFPQFLGPSRNAAVENLVVHPDWQDRPPVKLWSQDVGQGWSGFSAVNGYAVTMEQRDQQEWVTCYEINTGKLCWKHVLETRHETFLGGVGPRSTPTIDDGNVYALGATGILRCLSGENGTLIWQQDLLKLAATDPVADLKVVAWGRSASPLLVGDQVIIPLGGAPGGVLTSLVALHKQTGKVIWRSGDRQVSYGSPTVMTLDGKRQVVSVNEDTVSGHDLQTGELLWEHAWPGQSNGAATVSQPVAVTSDRILLSKGYQQGAMMLQVVPAARKAGSHRYLANPTWTNPGVLKTKFTNVTVLDGFAYGLSDGILECVDLQDGVRRWKRGRYGHGQVLRIGRQLLVLSEQGKLYLVALSPTGLQLQGEFQVLQGQCWATLCLYGDQLLVRSVDKIACYRLPLEMAAAGVEP
jgi:outer membrane protein assembly factor BamB